MWEEGKRRRRGGKIWSRGNEEVEIKREKGREVEKKREREGGREGGEEREKMNVSFISSESSSPKTEL